MVAASSKSWVTSSVGRASSCRSARKGNALPLAARKVPRPRARQVRDAKTLEQSVDWAAEADVLLDAEVGKQGVVLKEESDRALLGPPVDSSVEPRFAAHDATALRTNEACDRAK